MEEFREQAAEEVGRENCAASIGCWVKGRQFAEKSCLAQVSKFQCLWSRRLRVSKVTKADSPVPALEWLTRNHELLEIVVLGRSQD